MRMPLGFCDAGSTYKFIIKGKWKTPIAEISPQIVFRMNKTHEVFHWDFREGDKVRGPHKYHIWAKEKRDNKTSSAVTLSRMDLNLKKIPDFNMTITCSPDFEQRTCALITRLEHDQLSFSIK